MSARNINDAIQIIAKCNLSRYLAHANRNGLGYENSITSRANRDYKQFMLLMWVWANLPAPDSSIPPVPTGYAEKVWRAHFLDSEGYREFCATLIGRFIDHQPNFDCNSDRYRRGMAVSQYLQKFHCKQSVFSDVYTVYSLDKDMQSIA